MKFRVRLKTPKIIRAVAKAAAAVAVAPAAAAIQGATGDTKLTRNLTGKLIGTREVKGLGTATRVAAVATVGIVAAPVIASAAATGGSAILTAGGALAAKAKGALSSIFTSGPASLADRAKREAESAEPTASAPPDVPGAPSLGLGGIPQVPLAVGGGLVLAALAWLIFRRS